VTEEELLQSVRELAHGLGWLTYHTRMSKRSDPGWPDLVLVRGDRVAYRELKNATGKVTDEQQVWLDALAAAGADTGVWRPVDLASGEIQRDLLRGERDRTFGAQLAVRLAQARAKRSAPARRRRGQQLAPRLDP